MNSNKAPLIKIDSASLSGEMNHKLAPYNTPVNLYFYYNRNSAFTNKTAKKMTRGYIDFTSAKHTAQALT